MVARSPRVTLSPGWSRLGKVTGSGIQVGTSTWTRSSALLPGASSCGSSSTVSRTGDELVFAAVAAAEQSVDISASDDSSNDSSMSPARRGALLPGREARLTRRGFMAPSPCRCRYHYHYQS